MESTSGAIVEYAYGNSTMIGILAPGVSSVEKGMYVYYNLEDAIGRRGNTPRLPLHLTHGYRVIGHLSADNRESL